MAIWATLFYAYMLDEVYDNVDDGLKNQKIAIIREAYKNPSLLEINEYDINQFRILPTQGIFNERNQFSNELYYMPYDEEMEPYRVLKTGFYASDGRPYTLEIRTSTVEEDDLLLDFAVALMVLYIVLVLSVFFINRLVIRKVWKPFNTILGNLNHYEFGNQSDLQPVKTNVIEFYRLDKSIHQMWQRNEQIFEEQKTFIENASHELQTPLAIVINKLEVLLEDETFSEQHLQQLATIKVDLSRLVGLNKALLTLFRIENKQYKEVELVNFVHLSQNIIDNFAELLEYKEIGFDIISKNDFICKMNKNLAMILISNLIRNAIKYNLHGGIIQIESNATYFVIKNTGRKVSLNSDIIFTRFYKDMESNTSNGLGLAIVKSIINTYPYLSITYFFEQQKHCFCIRQEKSF